MDELILKSNRVIAEQFMDFKRSLYNSSVSYIEYPDLTPRLLTET